MARGIIGPGFDEYVQKQINLRQKNNRAYNQSDLKSIDIVKYQNANTAFLRLSSGVNINGSSDQARSYQLFNTQFGIKNSKGTFDYQIASGVNLGNYNSAYGFLSNSSYGYVPPPGLISADVKSLNRGSLREATIQMKCHSADQLEVINNLYLRLGFSMLLEWGWSHYFNNKGEYETNYHNVSNIFFEEGKDQTEILRWIQQDREKSNGNYDAMYGVVKNYSWSLEKDGSYDITLNLVSVGDVIESLKGNKSTPTALPSQPTTTSPPNDQTPPLEFNKEKSDLNKILYSLTQQIPPDGFNGGNWYLNNDKTTTSIINTNTGLKSNQDNNASGNIQGEVIGTYFPELKGIVGNNAGYNAQYFIKLGFFLRILQNYCLLYDVSKPGNTSLFNIDFDYDNSFMFTFPRHCSLDPRIALIPINQDVSPSNSSGTPSTSQYVIQKKIYSWSTVKVLDAGGKNMDGEYTIINWEEEVSNISVNWGGIIQNAFDGNGYTFDSYSDAAIAGWEDFKPNAPTSNNIINQIQYSEDNTTPVTSLDNFTIKESSKGITAQDLLNKLESSKNTVDDFDNGYVNNWENGYKPGYTADFGNVITKQITAVPGVLYMLDDGVEKGKHIEYKKYEIPGTFDGLYTSPHPGNFVIEVYTHQAVFGTVVDANSTYSSNNASSTSGKDVQNNLYDAIRPGSNFRISNYDFIGKTMSIYVNMDYIAKMLDSYIDIKTGAIAVYDLLDKLMNGVQNALGNVNNFNVTYDETSNTFHILDSTFIPGIADLKPEEFKKKPVEFITHTLEPTKGSFIREASIKTQLSNNFATSVTVGAQANGNVVGENATALSKWNTGLTDRIITNKDVKEKIDDKKDIEETHVSNIAILNQLQSLINDGNITNEQIDGAKNAGVDLFKYEIGKFTNDNTIPGGVGFLPINLELTMDGLSGMRIYESYTADTRLLPKNYKDAIQFIITGISHKIQKDDWTTTITSISGPKPDGKVGKPKPIKFDLKKGQESTSNTLKAESKDYTGDCKVPKVNYIRNNKKGAQGPSTHPEVITRKNKGIDNGNSKDLVKIAPLGNVKFRLNGEEPVLIKPAADAFNKWAEEITKQGGCMTVSSIFRTYAQQVAVKAKKEKEGKGKSAAKPGTSPHGWGIAIDISELYQLVNGDSSPSLNASAREKDIYKFIASTGEKFGWYNPWRLADGSGVDECWHFEYWGV